MKTSYTRRVQKGAQFLDQKNPEWEEKINLEVLDMKNPCLCVLGQVFGSFTEACWEDDYLDDNIVEFGFDVDVNNSFRRAYREDYDQRMLKLQDAWVSIIESRR